MDPDPDEHLHPGLEELTWSKEHEEKVKGQKPNALYNKFSEQARSLISTEKQCSYFCGGKKCKYCTTEPWSKEQMVINGLFSNWVTDKILAMARPTTKQIEEYKILEQFKTEGIRSIINLQTQGEHAECGPGLDKSGFSYDPQTFMMNDIYFYNFGWPDYGVAALSTILDMVKVVQFALSEGKVAIHCHAGLGRTGVIIACYLVFTNRMSGADAIHYVRSQRRGAIQTRLQMQCIQEFEKYLKPFRIVFASTAKDTHEFTLNQYLNRQKHILHGYEGRKLKYVPKILYFVCEKLLQLAGKGNSLSKLSARGSIASSLCSLEREKLATPKTTEKPTRKLKRDFSENALDSLVSKQDVKPSRSHKLLSKMQSISMEDLQNEEFERVLKNDGNESDSSSSSKPSIVYRLNSNDSSTVNSLTNSENDNTYNVLEPKDVAEALAVREPSQDCLDKAEKYEVNLNVIDDAWVELAMENDAVVLAQVMWDWLDQLKEPVLRAQDLSIITWCVDDPEAGLQKLERGTRFTIEYLLKVISKLKPLNSDLEATIFEKLISFLSHQSMTSLDMTDRSLMSSWASSTRSELNDDHHWGEMKMGTSAQLFSFFHKVQSMVESRSQ